MSERTKERINIFFEESFQVILATYLVFLLIEIYREGFISGVVDLNYFLLFMTITGVGMVLTDKKRENLLKQRNSISKEKTPDIYLLFSISLIVSLMIYVNIRELGNLSLVITFISLLLIFLLLYIVLNEEET